MSTSVGEKNENGHLKLGDNDQGTYGSPGSSITYSRVTFWLLANGDVRAVIDNRWGSNQGFFQENGGHVERITGGDLNEAVDLAAAHCADEEALTKACRIAGAEARATLRELDRQPVENPLSQFSDSELTAEMQRRGL